MSCIINGALTWQFKETQRSAQRYQLLILIKTSHEACGTVTASSDTTSKGFKHLTWKEDGEMYSEYGQIKQRHEGVELYGLSFKDLDSERPLDLIPKWQHSCVYYTLGKITAGHLDLTHRKQFIMCKSASQTVFSTIKMIT